MSKKKTEAQPIAGASFPGYEDLSRFDTVHIQNTTPLIDENYKSDESLMIHLTVTGRCYARCKGCVNSAVTLGSDEPRNTLIAFEETEPERDTFIIRELASRYPDLSITVCFYGGEPFLAVEKMESTWRLLRESDESARFKFMVYTSGELLSEALSRYPEFMKDMWLYSVSIDGNEEQHNRVRQGTQLRKIISNLQDLTACYRGYVLQWSTLREEQSLFSCFEEFMRLYQQGLVNHFFWHWAEKREPFINFPSFVEDYGRDLEKIMDIYVLKISEGKLLPVVHINELLLYLLTAQERGHTACGVELAKNYDIVSGKVYSCADLPNSHSIGELDKHGTLKLKEYELSSLVEYKNWLGCYSCGVHFYCGGRCPVQVVTGTEKGTYQYCQLMRLHVGIVQKRIPDIVKSIRENGIKLQEIYDRSAFLAKHTDVVP